jgi:hypothetical protein
MADQPKWAFVANLGDVNPLDHGGYLVYRRVPSQASFKIIEGLRRTEPDGMRTHSLGPAPFRQQHNFSRSVPASTESPS